MRVHGSGAEWGAQAASALMRAADSFAQAAFWSRFDGPFGSDEPKRRQGSDGPKSSGGPKSLNGLHLGQIYKLADNLESQGGSLDLQAIEGLTDRLADIIDKLGRLTVMIGEASPGAAPAAQGQAHASKKSAGPISFAAPTGNTASATVSGGSGGGTSDTSGGTGATSSTSSTSSLNTLRPFQGPTDFGSITINGVTTTFGTIDATGGLSANQVAGSLVNILNGNSDNEFIAQQRDNKILLIAKEAGTTLTIDDLTLGTSGANGFAGFLEGMSGSGTLLSNPISAIR